jgi:hypothetical protein
VSVSCAGARRASALKAFLEQVIRPDTVLEYCMRGFRGAACGTVDANYHYPWACSGPSLSFRFRALRAVERASRSGLPLFFHGGFPRGPLSEFHIAGLLGSQGGLTSDSLGGLCSGQGSLLSFNGQLGGCSLSDTGIVSPPDRVP